MSIILTEDNYLECDIALVPDQEGLELIKILNKQISEFLPNLENPLNNYHLTLYQAAFDKNDLLEIKLKLESLIVPIFKVNYTNLYSNQDRWIGLEIEKSSRLQSLHDQILDIFSPYHKRPLKSVLDIYDGLEMAAKDQAEQYGATGVREFFFPHITAFYHYPAYPKLNEILKPLARKAHKPFSSMVDKLILGKLDYNGNITEILHSIELRPEQISSQAKQIEYSNN